MPEAAPARPAGSEPRATRAPPALRFAEALALAARSSGPDAARAGRGAASPTGPPAPSRPPLRRTPARPAGPDAASLDPAAGAAGPGQAGAAFAAAPSSPELAAAVRALPPAAATLGARGKGELALGFGASLSVELRAGAQGVEVALRPAPALEPAARAALPGLVEALRARGVRVARAEVRPRPGGRRGRGTR